MLEHNRAAPCADVRVSERWPWSQVRWQGPGSWWHRVRLVSLVSGMVRPRLGLAKRQQGQQGCELALLLCKGLYACSRSAWVRDMRDAPASTKPCSHAGAYAMAKGSSHRAPGTLNERPKGFVLCSSRAVRVYERIAAAMSACLRQRRSKACAVVHVQVVRNWSSGVA
jgi:hypothetical protein